MTCIPLTVCNLLKKKNNLILTVSPKDTVYDAIRIMAEKKIGALLVLEGEKLVGVISERDYLTKIILLNRASKETLTEEIMSGNVHVVSLDSSVDECMALMTERKIRHLPVVEQEKVVGMISIGDVVREIIEERQFEIEQLEKYITG